MYFTIALWRLLQYVSSCPSLPTLPPPPHLPVLTSFYFCSVLHSYFQTHVVALFCSLRSFCSFIPGHSRFQISCHHVPFCWIPNIPFLLLNTTYGLFSNFGSFYFAKVLNPELPLRIYLFFFLKKDTFLFTKDYDCTVHRAQVQNVPIYLAFSVQVIKIVSLIPP